MGSPLVFGETLWEDRNGFVEIRALAGTRVVARDFYEWPTESQPYEKRVGQLASYNVYAGILLRTSRGAGTATDVESPVWTLWADLDKKSGATFKSVLAALLPDPTMVVDSGHGWHLYWSLTQGVSHQDAEAIMRGIALEYGGDAVGDVARIMRVPGSFNVKSSPIGARIIHLDNHKVKPSDFSPVSGSIARPMAHGATMTRGTRSELIFAAVIEWTKAGLSDDEIYDRLLTEPIGEKVQEMKTDKRRRDWVNLTIRKARNVD